MSNQNVKQTKALTCLGKYCKEILRRCDFLTSLINFFGDLNDPEQQALVFWSPPGFNFTTNCLSLSLDAISTKDSSAGEDMSSDTIVFCSKVNKAD